MGGAFTMLRAHDLLWQPAVKSYLKGERDGMIDLMAWNADGTRMPWKMHTEYLIGLYLSNDLAEGRFKVEGETGRASRTSACRCSSSAPRPITSRHGSRSTRWAG